MGGETEQDKLQGRQARSGHTKTTKTEQQQARRCRGALLHENSTPYGTYNSMKTVRERNADGQAARCSDRNTQGNQNENENRYVPISCT